MPDRQQRPSNAELDMMFRTLEKVLPEFKEYIARKVESQQAVEQREGASHLSYVQLAIALLEEIGKPTPITVLLEQIRERRNDPTITRGSVETSLLRHLNSKGDNTEVVKPFPGTYALRSHLFHARG